MAMPPTRPERAPADDSAPPVPPPPPIDAGPTDVHSWLDRASDWPRVKIRKLALMSSLPGSPSPLVGSGFWKVSDQLFSVPVAAGRRAFWMTSVQVPWTFSAGERRWPGTPAG